MNAKCLFLSSDRLRKPTVDNPEPAELVGWVKARLPWLDGATGKCFEGQRETLRKIKD